MDPLLHGDISPELERAARTSSGDSGGEGIVVVVAVVVVLQGDGLCGELDEQLGYLGFLGVVVGWVGFGLALVAGEHVVSLDVAGAARVNPHAALVAFHHLFAVVKVHAAHAVYRP